MNEITMQELEEKLNNGEELNMIDVREDDEVAVGMIPGANHIRLGDLPDRENELDKNKHYYIVCRSGGRSGKATQYLNQNGYKATNVQGGMLAYNG